MRTRMIAAIVIALGMTTGAGAWLSRSPQPVAEHKETASHTDSTLAAPAPAATALSSFLVVSDVHLDLSLKNDSLNNGANSNATLNLWNKTKEEIRYIVSTRKPKFIILDGDLGAHGASKPYALSELKVIMDTMRAIAEAQQIALLYAPGNNDIPGTHNGTFSASKDLPPYPGWPMSDGPPGAGVIAPADRDDLGYYSLHPIAGGKLRVIAMNTVPYMKGYSGNINPDTLFKQLAWVAQELHAANVAGEKVLITMHVPYSEWANVPINRSGATAGALFSQLLAGAKSDIIAVLTSHTHISGINLYTDPASGKPHPVNLSIPGVTLGHGNLPSLQLITYADSAYTVRDFEIFYHQCKRTNPVPVTSWGSAEYSFSTATRKPAGMSLYDYFSALTPTQRQSIVSAMQQQDHE